MYSRVLSWHGSNYLYTLCLIKRESVKVESKVSEPFVDLKIRFFQWIH